LKISIKPFAYSLPVPADLQGTHERHSGDSSLDGISVEFTFPTGSMHGSNALKLMPLLVVAKSTKSTFFIQKN